MTAKRPDDPLIPYRSGGAILAPLSGYTDLPYRRSARRFGCRWAFTEMIDAGSLVFGNEKTLRFINRGPDEAWLGAQLIGSDLDTLREASRVLNDHDFDVLDFNLGCPAPKVIRKGEGAALGRDLNKAANAFRTLAETSRFPVTAKIRVLSETDPEPTVALAQALAREGARAVVVHARLQSAFYSGPVHHAMIAAVREALDIPVVANGGVVDWRTRDQARDATGCETVMVARGAMGNPWLFAELSNPATFKPPTPLELSAEMERHVLEVIGYYGEALGTRISRKLILDYLRGRGFPGALKNKVAKLLSIGDVREFIDEVGGGPSPRYWTWLRGNPTAPRRLRPT